MPAAPHALQASGPVCPVGPDGPRAAALAPYTFPLNQELAWFKQIVADSRLLTGLQVMCQEVQLARLPYAPLLALHYQLGGRFKFPGPEACNVSCFELTG